jgi:serine O-acetyltransferase
MNAITVYRFGRWCHLRRIPLVPRLVHYVIFTFYNSYVPAAAEIGPGTLLLCGGMGVVVHPGTRIGRNVMIGTQVTFGGRGGQGRTGLPVVEDNVRIGAGTRILGPIRVGEGALIGPNSVVIDDVPARSIVAGIPAKVLRLDIDPKDYL